MSAVKEYSDRRRYPRAHGPFLGWYVGPSRTPVRISDLNVGGGFVRSAPGQPLAPSMPMQIDLGAQGVIEVVATTLYQAQGGAAVAFVNLSFDPSERIRRTVEAFN